MYQFNARSPCPAPIGSTHSKASWNSTFDLSALEDDTCNVEYTREILVRDNIQRQRMGAPRRPKRAVDIQIHVDRTRERDEKVNPALNGSHEENASALLDISTAYVPPQRATLAQPAQRFRLRPLAAAKRETKSAVQDDRTTSSPRNLRTLPTDRTQKDLRRRTIYIPEDTTIMTIHPGTLLSEDRNLDDHIRQRDRASLVLEGKCEPGANQHEVETEIVKAGRPRKSLAVAPRRIPLQQTTPKQMTSLLIDVAGYGGGKENVPPAHACCSEKKPSPLRTSVVRNVQNAHVKHSACTPPKGTSPGTKLSAPLILSCVRHESDWKSGRDRQDNPQSSHEQFHTSRAPVGSTRRSKSGMAFHRGPLKTSSIGQPLLSSKSSKYPESWSASVASKEPRSGLSHPLESTLDIQAYPMLSDDVAHPELYSAGLLDHKEVAMTEMVNEILSRAGHRCQNEFCAEPGVRKRLLDVYHCPDTVTLHKRICASLSYGALSIPKATIEKLRLQDDLGSRRRFLDFWLDTYDWTILQPALEAVIGREMAKPTQDSEIARCKSKTIRRLFDKKGLESFLETFLICTGDVVRTRRASGCIKATVHRTKHNSEDVGLEVWSWQQTMLRSLMLIYLLDKAKSEAIFTRCLFRPEAVYKSSLAVLQALGARLTPSIGDITRHLKHLNYDVGYVQYPLQEYVYRITNVAVDLRDGVLLTRLVELLCCHPAGLPPYEVQIHDGSPSWALSQYLKFPCLGRAQKLYNVQIALDALSDCVSSISIADGVKAEDIVDGHREKTLGLLWSLVSRFGFCKLLDLVDFTQEVEKWRQNKKGLGTRTSKSSQPDAAQNMVAYKELLQVWAREVCRTKDILVTNLTTSYTDGKVFATIVSAYTNSILPPGSLPTSPGAAAAQLQTSLRVLGCSLSFVKLLACDKSTIPTQETTLATLALLAARILPRIRAYRAAATIQRAVRLRIARQTITRRVMLMHLAHDCATVVETRERLVLATSLLQRRWREVLAVRRMRLDTMVEVFQVVAKGWLARRAVQGNLTLNVQVIAL
ncbi:hypothetical protein LTR66_001300 [Elasticomyces elasticus]|nr:hypothetical protein LTR66_001300 [Elasticomyces elasticus]